MKNAIYFEGQAVGCLAINFLHQMGMVVKYLVATIVFESISDECFVYFDK